MRHSFTAPVAISALALAGLFACHSDPVSPASDEQTATAYLRTDRATAGLAAGGSKVFVVDNDRVDCPRADFTSIQAAVTAADPGSTILVCPGTYYEQVTIAKNELRLLAKGKPGDVKLDGQDEHAKLAGFLLLNAHGNLIEGFLIRRYHEAGIWLRTGSSRNTIRSNLTTENGHDGIQVQNSPQNMIEHNTSFANPSAIACGINIAAAGSIGNIIRHNETFQNQFGIQVIGGAANNVIFDNSSHDNRRLGIRNIVGSNGTKIENNRVFDNTLEGILVTSSTGVTVARNKAFGNTPDLFSDAIVLNVFRNNHCRTSVPLGLCEHTEGASKD